MKMIAAVLMSLVMLACLVAAGWAVHRGFWEVAALCLAFALMEMLLIRWAL